MKITGTIIRFALVSMVAGRPPWTKTAVCGPSICPSGLVAGEGFASALSRQRALKNLRHQDLNLVEANFDWLDSPTIRFVRNLKKSLKFYVFLKLFFSKIVRRQLGIIYHHYNSKADRGVLLDDKKLAAFTKELKTHFKNVKDQTKARFGNKKSTKSRKPRDNQKNPVDRRMLYRKYWRS